jgi:hypothetical protein
MSDVTNDTNDKEPVMFSQHFTNEAIARQHRDRLMDSASRHRMVFGRRGSTSASSGPSPTHAEVLALPARMDRTSPRDSRVA